MMLITFGIHLFWKCTKNVFLICLVYFQNCAATKKKSLWFQSIPLSKWTMYASILKFFSLNLMPKRGQNSPQCLKVGRTIAPSSIAHEVVLMKFELQIHMVHLSWCQSGFLVVCASQSSVFWVFVIFCQPLNICLFVMLYLYTGIYIIYCY
jgi:hypothetical protein